MISSDPHGVQFNGQCTSLMSHGLRIAPLREMPLPLASRTPQSLGFSPAFLVSLSHFPLVSPVLWGFPGGLVVKNLPANAGDERDLGSIPGLGRSPGGGNDNPLQYSCLENLIDRDAWRATVHGVAKSQTQLSG